MEKKIETTIVCWAKIGIMEKSMKTTIVYWGYMGVMDRKMEITIVYRGSMGIMDKKENGIYYEGPVHCQILTHNVRKGISPTYDPKVT